MPVYVYETEQGRRFEVLQRHDEPALCVCPDTGERCKRVVAASAMKMGRLGRHVLPGDESAVAEGKAWAEKFKAEQGAMR